MRRLPTLLWMVLGALAGCADDAPPPAGHGAGDVVSVAPDTDAGATSAPLPVEPLRSPREEVVALRASRRAFDGAPPAIPHPVGPLQQDCLACHRTQITLNGKTAPVMPHRELTMCRQCHVEQAPGTFSDIAGGPHDVPNGFVGLVSGGEGPRAAPGAPPRMPHSAWLRERCTACHGRYAREGLRSPHAERAMCEQCHVAFDGLEVRGAPSGGAPRLR